MHKNEEYLPISAIQHFAFCRRQFALIYMEKQWVENYLTSSGRLIHQRVHDKDIFQTKGDIIALRGLALNSKQLKLFGVSDLVEYKKVDKGVNIVGFEGEYLPYPVEYKRGKKKANNCDRLQVCTQGICLEEMHGCVIEEGAIFYGQPRRRETVKLDSLLRNEVFKACSEMHELYLSGLTPAPSYSKKCTGCSMYHICQPKLISKKDDYWDKMLKYARVDNEKT